MLERARARARRIRLRARWSGFRGFTGGCVAVSLFSIVVTDMHPLLWAWFFVNLAVFGLSVYKLRGLKEEDDVVEFARSVLGIELLPHQEEFLRQSRGELRFTILRGTQQEAMAAFEELMRRNMEE